MKTDARLQDFKTEKLMQNVCRNLTGEEAREAGSIGSSTLKPYGRAAGGWALGIALIALFSMEQGIRVWTDTWVGLWAQNTYTQGVWFYLGIYFALGCAYALTTFVR